MGKNYQLKYVSDEVWDGLSDLMKRKKNNYQGLLYKIKRKESKIERLKREIKETQEEMRLMKSERTTLLEELREFTEKYIPSVSPYQSVYNNNQWSVNLKIGDIKKTIYLGSDKKVRIQVDDIKGFDLFESRQGNIDDLSEKLKEIVRDILQKNISRDVERDFEGMRNKLKDKKLKMWDYLR